MPGWGANFHENFIFFAKLLEICHYRGISTNTAQYSNLLDLSYVNLKAMILTGKSIIKVEEGCLGKELILKINKNNKNKLGKTRNSI